MGPAGRNREAEWGAAQLRAAVPQASAPSWGGGVTSPTVSRWERQGAELPQAPAGPGRKCCLLPPGRCEGESTCPQHSTPGRCCPTCPPLYSRGVPGAEASHLLRDMHVRTPGNMASFLQHRHLISVLHCAASGVAAVSKARPPATAFWGVSERRNQTRV